MRLQRLICVITSISKYPTKILSSTRAEFFFKKKTIPNVSSMVQAIHETLMAGAAVTIQDAPPHRRVDAAGAVALPASKARRRRLRGVRPLHGEAGGHAPEAPAQDGSGPGRPIG